MSNDAAAEENTSDWADAMCIGCGYAFLGRS
jgi:hypothetical protein